MTALHDPAVGAEPRVATSGERLWFLGTLARMKLDGEETAGRFAMWEGMLPHGAAPPLHSHPQDETFYVLEGEDRAIFDQLEGMVRSGALTRDRGAAV